MRTIKSFIYRGGSFYYDASVKRFIFLYVLTQASFHTYKAYKVNIHMTFAARSCHSYTFRNTMAYRGISERVLYL